jgi:hypothetical protein
MHQGSLMDGFNLRTAKAAGIILVGREKVLNRDDVAYLYDKLTEDIVTQLGGGLIYKGVYKDEKIDFIRVLTMFSGLTLPSVKVDALLDEVRKGYAAMQKKENRITGLDFDVEDIGGSSRPKGMDRLVDFKNGEE